MKRLMILLAALLLLPVLAFAEPSLALNETAVVANMLCSWAQGYEPRIEGNTLIVQVPVRATDMTQVKVALFADDPEISPLAAQGTGTTAYRNDRGEYNAQLKVSLVRGRINGDYPCTLRLTGTAKGGGTVQAERHFVLHIRDGRSPEGLLRPMISEVDGDLLVGGESKVTMTIANPSAYADITGLTLKVADPTGMILPVGTDIRLLPDLPAGASMPVEVPLFVKADTPATIHALALSLKYTMLDRPGEWTETFTLPVTAADDEVALEKTHPMLSGVNATLLVGEDATLTVALENPSSQSNMTDITLKLTDGTGDILPQGTDTLRLPDLPAGQTFTATVPLTVRPNAAVSLHVLRFEIGYRVEGKHMAWTESFTLPVNQEIRLEQGGVTLSPTILQGELANLTLPLMNMGRSELRNVLVTLHLPGITERQSVLVGTIAAGETKQARVTFTPGKRTEGFHQGTLTVTAEDAYGNQTSFTLPVETTVEAAPDVTVNVQRQTEEAKMPWLTIGLAGACAVLLLGCILQGMILRRKIRKLEEAKL